MGKYTISALLLFQSFALCLMVENFDVKRLEINDNLAHLSIKSIYQDHMGYVWIATAGGLHRYDGQQINIYTHNPQDSTSLPHDDVRDVFEDNQGQLYVCTRGGFAAFDRQKRTFSKTLDIPVKSGVLDSTSIWITSDGAGLIRHDASNNSFTFFTHDSPDSISILSNFVNRIFFDYDADMWIGYDIVGLELRQNKNGITFNLPNPNTEPQQRVNSLAQDPSGLIWVGTELHGLSVLDKAKQAILSPDLFYSIPKSVTQSTIRELFMEKNRMWIGTGNGLYVYDFATDQCLYIFGKPGKNIEHPFTVNCIYRDKQDLLWFGTRNGLYHVIERHTLQHVCNFIDTLSLQQNRVWSFLAEGDSVWVGTDVGLLKWKPSINKFMLYAPNDNMPAVRAILRVNSHQLYILTLGGRLFPFNCLNASFGSPVKMASSSVFQNTGYCAICDPQNGFWIGTNGTGLFHYSPHSGEIQNFEYPKRTATHWILDILLDPTCNSLWCGTWEHGLMRFDMAHESFVAENEALLSHSNNKQPTILCIERDTSGNLWLGTYSDGLFCYDTDAKEAQCFSKAHGLPSNIIYCMTWDNNNKLWLGTNNGLAQFDPQTLSCRLFDESDGLQGLEFNSGAAARTPDGQLLFGGNNGINIINPEVHANSFPPRIVLDQIQIFGESISPASRQTASGAYKFSHRESFISLKMAVLHFKNPDKNRLLYRIRNHSELWVDLQQQRQVVLSHMTPGKYNLEIVAVNSDGVRTLHPFQLRIVITPPFWRSIWFYIGLVGTIALFIKMFTTWRVRQSLQIERIREKERDHMRQKLAADFHDEVGHRLTKISLLGEILRTRYKKTHPDIAERTSRVIQHAHQIRADLREFIWELDDKKSSLHDFLAQLGHFGDQLCEDTNLQFELLGIKEGFADIQLTPEWREHLLRIFKEAMHNALKHAHATVLQLECQVTDNHLMLKLCDDGQGFDEKTIARKGGIRHMRERALALDGTILIRSSEKLGTSITFFGILP